MLHLLKKIFLFIFSVFSLVPKVNNNNLTEKLLHFIYNRLFCQKLAGALEID